MSNHRTFRVHVTSTTSHVIDLPARSEEHALDRAERLWDRGEKTRFNPVLGITPAHFEIDELATVMLADIANDDRARWAGAALQEFARKTGSGTSDEGLHDLLADLGHYADQHGINFIDCVARAIGCFELERRGHEGTDQAPQVTITIGAGGDPP